MAQPVPVANDNWSAMPNWSLVLPPSRPHRRELDKIRSISTQAPQPMTTAILGSTPEFRDLAHELGGAVTVYDRSVDFYRQMALLRVHDNPERFVHGDWLDTLVAEQERFSLVLSDLTAGNVPYDDRPAFYDAITELLRPGGFFIDKNLTNEAALLPLSAIRRKYAHAPLNLASANYFSCDAIFCSTVQAEEGFIDSTHVYAVLDDAYSDPRWMALTRAARLITPENCLWYYGRPWKTLEPGYCPELTLVAKSSSPRTLPYHNRAFQFIWRKPT